MRAFVRGTLWTLLVLGAIVAAFYASIKYLDGACCLGLELLMVLIASLVLGIVPAAVIDLFFAKIVRRPRWGAIGFYTVLGAVFIFILVPQLGMTHKLVPLARNFHQACQADHREYQSDDPEVVVADFGGSLDNITFERDDVLRADQYLGLGGWHYKNSSATVGMLYLYTYLPKTTFDRWFPDPYRPAESQEAKGRG